MSTKHFPLVMIRWRDHSGQPRPENWRTIEEATAEKPLPITSVGFLINDGKDYKTLAGVMSDDHFVSGLQCIISSAIERITHLVPKRKRS